MLKSIKKYARPKNKLIYVQSLTSCLAIIFGIAFLCWSCQAEGPVSPIPEAELEEIITEALILEPAGRELPLAVQDSVATVYYGKILEQHGYTMDEFVSAMAWLQRDSERLASMYNKVMERLTVMESEQK